MMIFRLIVLLPLIVAVILSLPIILFLEVLDVNTDRWCIIQRKIIRSFKI